MLKKVFSISALTVALQMAAPAFAIQAQPSGQVQIQAAYVSEAINDHNWLVQMPNTYIGVSALESLPSGTFRAHWRAGFEPFADELTLDQQQMYVQWQQGAFALWGGELPTLESVLIESEMSTLVSAARGGLAVANYIVPTEKKALRADFQSNEAVLFTGQWVFDETKTDQQWSIGAVVQSPEGSIATTYRQTEAGNNQWGTRLRWVSGTTTFFAATLYEESLLAWDVGLQVQGARAMSFVNYSVDGDEDGLWRLGLHQNLTQSLINFSEIVWDADANLQWSTGFQLKF